VNWALEDGILQVVAVAAHGFEDLAEAFVFADVVTDEIGLPHRADSLVALYRGGLTDKSRYQKHGLSYDVSIKLRKRITERLNRARSLASRVPMRRPSLVRVTVVILSAMR
jgi:hypothetical protein